MIRGSLRSLRSLAHSARATGSRASSSASTSAEFATMVRNLKQGNSWPCRPTRVWAKITAAAVGQPDLGRHQRQQGRQEQQQHARPPPGRRRA